MNCTSYETPPYAFQPPVTSSLLGPDILYSIHMNISEFDCVTDFQPAYSFATRNRAIVWPSRLATYSNQTV